MRCRLRSELLLALALALTACSAGRDVPAWSRLEVGAQARLGPSDHQDPEHTAVFASAAEALASLQGQAPSASAYQAEAGALVTIDVIQPAAAGSQLHIVHVADPGDSWSGWVAAERVLSPVPPDRTMLQVTPVAGSEQSMLYLEQDDDEGVPFGSTTLVTYLGFSKNPGNPEYHIEVVDGPLAGKTGYVLADELTISASQPFAFVAR